MLGKIRISCYYEHCFLSVRKGEVVETRGILIRRVYGVLPCGFMVRLGGEWDT
jgi:hypothetical protein